MICIKYKFADKKTAVELSPPKKKLLFETIIVEFSSQETRAILTAGEYRQRRKFSVLIFKSTCLMAVKSKEKII